MEQFHCESDKALRILKMMFQMGYGNKIGKEYYVSLNSQLDFLDKMRGKEVFIQCVVVFGHVSTITFNYHLLKRLAKNEQKTF